MWAYPEAEDWIEAHMLAALARAESPAAIDLLLAQPALWRGLLADGPAAASAARILTESDRLDMLLTPPTVALFGRPNVGKSTLTNRLLGHTASIVNEQAGTTRDWVGGVAHLHGPGTGGEPAIAVHWIDTPGLRTAADPVEAHAIRMAQPVVASAALRIAMRDDESDWPDEAIEAGASVWVVNKADRTPPSAVGNGDSADHPLPISAERGDGVDALEVAIVQKLGLMPPDPPVPWAFDPHLRARLTAVTGATG